LSDKRPYTIHIEETRHFEFEVWADTKSAALEEAQRIWREAPTTGQWELPDTATDYRAALNEGRK
jgi:hypothetical protein